MKSQTLDKLFIDELEDMFSSEKQITESLPKLIKLATSPELKKALSKHLKETEEQIERIEKIFSLLELPLKEKTCEAMEGILKEADELVANKTKTTMLDVAIISAAQKVEHYEIASYHSLCSFAKHLELDDDIIALLQDTLDEEKAADRKLMKIGEEELESGNKNKETGKSHSKKSTKK